MTLSILSFCYEFCLFPCARPRCSCAVSPHGAIIGSAGSWQNDGGVQDPKRSSIEEENEEVLTKRNDRRGNCHWSFWYRGRGGTFEGIKEVSILSFVLVSGNGKTHDTFLLPLSRPLLTSCEHRRLKRAKEKTQKMKAKENGAAATSWGEEGEAGDEGGLAAAAATGIGEEADQLVAGDELETAMMLRADHRVRSFDFAPAMSDGGKGTGSRVLVALHNNSLEVWGLEGAAAATGEGGLKRGELKCMRWRENVGHVDNLLGALDGVGFILKSLYV